VLRESRSLDQLLRIHAEGFFLRNAPEHHAQPENSRCGCDGGGRLPAHTFEKLGGARIDTGIWLYRSTERQPVGVVNSNSKKDRNEVRLLEGGLVFTKRTGFC
jgi:hypothetical protein